MRANFVVSEVATGLRRNLTMTVAMILTTAISLGFFGGGLLVAGQINDMKKLYYDKLQVSIYLKNDITEDQRQTLDAELKASPEVRTVEYLTKQQSYERFKRLFANQENLVQYAGPDDLPPTFLVQLKNPERYTVISDQFKSAPGVDQVQDQSQVLDSLFAVFNGIRNFAIFIAVLMALAALLLIANTIQVAAFNRRTETGIMRLVGASRWYTQLPFVLEAAVAGLVGAVLAVIGLFGFKYLFVDRVLGTPIKSGVITELDAGTILAIGPVVGLVGVLAACVAAYVTLRLYVRL